MDKETLKDRLADELEAAKSPEVLHKVWFRQLSMATDIPSDSLKTYQAGTHECPASRLLTLFDHLGPEFEARVRGTATSPTDRQAEIRLLLEQALEALNVRDNVADIAASFAQRTDVK